MKTVGLTPSEACRLIAVSIDLIDLCAKVTGKIDRAIASIVGYAHDEALAEALEIAFMTSMANAYGKCHDRIGRDKTYGYDPWI